MEICKCVNDGKKCGKLHFFLRISDFFRIFAGKFDPTDIMKKTLPLIYAIVVALIGTGTLFTLQYYSRPTAPRPIVILYDNDVHCAVDGYAKMAGLRDSLTQHTPYVLVLSQGDYAQGDVMGSLTEGEYMVQLMNDVPYDYVTLGNHEFDYSVARMQENGSSLTAQTLCCNITGPKGDLYAGYTLQKIGGVKIGIVGVATPTTFTSSTPTYFQDEQGKVIYDFHATDTYERVQKAVDKLRKKGADYVIVMSHLGDDVELCPSPELIAHTSGIDAVLDGHSHHVINTYLTNALGDSVLLASTGTKFQNYGILTIDKTGLHNELRPNASVTVERESTKALIAQLRQQLAEKTEQVVGYTATGLSDKDAQGKRLVRRAPTELGTFLCDAFRHEANAQIGVMNGGGIRSSIDSGAVTMGEIYSVLPFNNRIWRKKTTGQQLLDALEMGVRNLPEEDGDYPQMAGARFSCDLTIPSSVIVDEHQFFAGIGKTRRITRLEIEKAPGVWEPICPDSTYTIAGQSYIMVSGGASNMFGEMEKDFGPGVTDVEAVVNYIHSLGDTIVVKKTEPIAAESHKSQSAHRKGRRRSR